jgi:hypothetical protein
VTVGQHEIATSPHHIVAVLVLTMAALAAVSGCGKKGAPLPPLQRIPAAVANVSVTRFDQEVFVQFTVPTTNVDGAVPPDLARVELYAITSDEPLAAVQGQDAEALRRVSTLLQSFDVRRPLPPPPPVKEGMPPLPVPPPGPGVDPGATLVVRELLTPEMSAIVPLPDREEQLEDATSAEATRDLPRPLVAPLEAGGPVRYYYAVGISPRRRYGPISGLQGAPLGPPSSAPGTPEIIVEETAMTIRWAPAADARGAVHPTPEGLLPSRPIAPGPPPTMYEVFEVPKEPAATNASPEAPAMPAAPTPITQGAIGGTEFRQENITLGTERCFVVRPVDIVSGLHVRGPASPMACSPFADVFAPVAPSSLATAPSAGVINLIWEPSPSSDLAGYLVLRGDAATGAALAPLMKEPISTTTYADAAVQPGVRYIYAIVAVDNAGNRSAESNRQEETARP